MLIVKEWADVDRALEGIGMLDLEEGELSSSLGRRLYDLVAEYSEEFTGIAEKRRGLESAIEAFCLCNKGEFAHKRSKQLQYGKIAFRTAERIEIPEELEDSVIATLKRLGYSDCLEIKERIDRSSLKRLSDSDLARCGIRRAREDRLRIEPDLESISHLFGNKAPSLPAFSVDLQKLGKAVRRNEATEGSAPEDPVAAEIAA